MNRSQSLRAEALAAGAARLLSRADLRAITRAQQKLHEAAVILRSGAAPTPRLRREIAGLRLLLENARQICGERSAEPPAERPPAAWMA